MAKTDDQHALIKEWAAEAEMSVSGFALYCGIDQGRVASRTIDDPTHHFTPRVWAKFVAGRERWLAEKAAKEAAAKQGDPISARIMDLTIAAIFSALIRRPLSENDKDRARRMALHIAGGLRRRLEKGAQVDDTTAADLAEDFLDSSLSGEVEGDL